MLANLRGLVAAVPAAEAMHICEIHRCFCSLRRRSRHTLPMQLAVWLRYSEQIPTSITNANPMLSFVVSLLPFE